MANIILNIDHDVLKSAIVTYGYEQAILTFNTSIDYIVSILESLNDSAITKGAFDGDTSIWSSNFDTNCMYTNIVITKTNPKWIPR